MDFHGYVSLREGKCYREIIPVAHAWSGELHQGLETSLGLAGFSCLIYQDAIDMICHDLFINLYLYIYIIKMIHILFIYIYTHTQSSYT